MKTQKKNKCIQGQISLELSISIFLALLLLVATVRIFVWLSHRMVIRQQDYESTRVEAGSIEPENPREIQVDESNYPRLNIFENWSR